MPADLGPVFWIHLLSIRGDRPPPPGDQNNTYLQVNVKTPFVQTHRLERWAAARFTLHGNIFPANHVCSHRAARTALAGGPEKNKKTGDGGQRS